MKDFEVYETLKTTDATIWADQFLGVIHSPGAIIDRDLMIAWFSQALMVGFDLGKQELEDETRE